MLRWSTCSQSDCATPRAGGGWLWIRWLLSISVSTPPVSTHPGGSLHPNCPGGDVSECGLPLSPAGPLLRLHLCPDPHLPQAAGVQPLQVSVDIRIYLFIYTHPCRPQDGLIVDTFRLPSACSCHIGPWPAAPVCQYQCSWFLPPYSCHLNSTIATLAIAKCTYLYGKMNIYVLWKRQWICQMWKIGSVMSIWQV